MTQSSQTKPEAKTIRIVAMARQMASAMKTPAYLVLGRLFFRGAGVLGASIKVNVTPASKVS